MTNLTPTSERLIVLGWSGCPTTSGIEAWITEACAEAGVARPPIAIHFVETQEEADARHFVGSPTFVVEGRDLFPNATSTPALTCRIYILPDGRPSPLPDSGEFARRLAAALTQD